MMGEGRIHTKGKKVGHCRVSQRLLSMIAGSYVMLFIGQILAINLVSIFEFLPLICDWWTTTKC